MVHAKIENIQGGKTVTIKVLKSSEMIYVEPCQAIKIIVGNIGDRIAGNVDIQQIRQRVITKFANFVVAKVQINDCWYKLIVAG